jgi:hypothetical protein
MQPLWRPAQRQSEQRQLILWDRSSSSCPGFFGKTIFSESQWWSQWFFYLLLNDRND